MAIDADLRRALAHARRHASHHLVERWISSSFDGWRSLRLKSANRLTCISGTHMVQAVDMRRNYPRTTIAMSIVVVALVALTSCSSSSPESSEGADEPTHAADSPIPTTEGRFSSDTPAALAARESERPPVTVDPARVIEALPEIQKETLSRLLMSQAEAILATGTTPADDESEHERIRNEVIDEKTAELRRSDPAAAIGHLEAIRDMKAVVGTVHGFATFSERDADS